ncbi:hypothetical protein ACTTAL_17650 [Rhodobacter capsulatus]|uniref:hypothetical protein n=1 Tax=Rhodobacter capsulatus TaxID=1061 RepID=UPI0003D2B4EF|nr:hypothetical protein [Rhodobacter capsulatus]ETD87285.1 hypothetical protein U713_17015 [Rhodobacter capsulatus YW2]
MATSSIIIGINVSEPHFSSTLTPCGEAFSALLGALPDYYEAERDLDGIDAHDLACDAWISAAERARSEVIAALDTVIDAKPQVQSDLHLRRTALLFSAALRTDDPVVYSRVHGAMRDLPWLYRVEGRDQGAQHATIQLQMFRHHLLSLMTLGEFQPEFAIVDAACVDISETFETAPAAI